MLLPSETKGILERRLSVTNLSLEKNLPTFRLNAPVIIRAKVRTNTAIYSDALLRIHIIGGQRIAPPSLLITVKILRL